MDLIAWAMETNRAVYMIRMDCLVDVFEPLKTPFTIALKDASPSEEATVMVHTGDHFNSYIASPRIAKRSSSLAVFILHFGCRGRLRQRRQMYPCAPVGRSS